MLLTLLLLGALGGYGAWEFHLHQRRIPRVPLRVLVNGTRGKSSVTRLIAGGLRRGGLVTLGKTTGTKPRLITPDGVDHPIHRVGRPNIIEQVMVFRRALELRAEALVTECMAILPPNQTIMQDQLVRSTIGVITNVRADHLDDMGPGLEDVARCLARTIPRDGIVFTAERDHLPLLEEEARRRHARLVAVTGEEVDPAVLRRFSYCEHRENIAVALAVCEHAGVPRATALEGMAEAAPDPGVLRLYEIPHAGHRVLFVNAFAANDPDSYVRIWDLLAPLAAEAGHTTVIVNCRRDRVQRTESLADLIARRLQAGLFVLAGEATTPLEVRARALGLRPDRLVNLGGAAAAQVVDGVLARITGDTLVVGIGNIVGLGEEIVAHFAAQGHERAL
jgi:poly-gamma-glutamate synthase PgsB/CapB